MIATFPVFSFIFDIIVLPSKCLVIYENKDMYLFCF